METSYTGTSTKPAKLVKVKFVARKRKKDPETAPSSHNHGSVKNGYPASISSYLSNTAIFYHFPLPPWMWEKD